MRYFTSDLHLGHRNIVDYARRPFRDTDEMAEHLIGRWHATVTDRDEVWVLGDLVMGRLDQTMALLDRLPGQVILVPGNHDRCWVGWPHAKDPAKNAAKLDEWRRRYLDQGVAEIIDAPVTVDISETKVRVHHFPFAGGGDHSREERYEEWRLADDGSWLLCGHVHDLFRQRGRQINVGVDAWGGELVSSDELAELISQRPTDASPLPWPEHLGPSGASTSTRSRAVRHAAVALMGDELSDKALRRLRNRAAAEWPAVLEVLREDGAGDLAMDVERRLLPPDADADAEPAPLVTGGDIMALGVPAGPRVGELLRWISSEQEAQRLTTTDDALDALRARVDGESSI